jgi:hypothetical protein
MTQQNNDTNLAAYNMRICVMSADGLRQLNFVLLSALVCADGILISLLIKLYPSIFNQHLYRTEVFQIPTQTQML